MSINQIAWERVEWRFDRQAISSIGFRADIYFPHTHSMGLTIWYMWSSSKILGAFGV